MLQFLKKTQQSFIRTKSVLSLSKYKEDFNKYINKMKVKIKGKNCIQQN